MCSGRLCQHEVRTKSACQTRSAKDASLTAAARLVPAFVRAFCRGGHVPAGGSRLARPSSAPLCRLVPSVSPFRVLTFKTKFLRPLGATVLDYGPLRIEWWPHSLMFTLCCHACL